MIVFCFDLPMKYVSWSGTQVRVRAMTLLFLLSAGAYAAQAGSDVAATNSPSEQPNPDDRQYPGCPPPVLPQEAFLLARYANLELTISAERDGTVKNVDISKPSRAKLYDEYTRKWVEKNWKMPPAKPGEPELRKFIAPIVYPKAELPRGGHFPAPTYPYEFLRNRIEGLVIVEMVIEPSGQIRSARTAVSSGHKELDEYTSAWVKRYWKFPPGPKRIFYWPCAYTIQ